MLKNQQKIDKICFLQRCHGAADDLAPHGLAVELAVVVDFDGLHGVGLVNVDDLGGAGRRNSNALQMSDVAEQLLDVFDGDGVLQVGDDHFGALKTKFKFKYCWDSQ